MGENLNLSLNNYSEDGATAALLSFKNLGSVLFKQKISISNLSASFQSWCRAF